MRILAAYFPAVLGLFALVVGILYCMQNTSGHSGIDPMRASLLFLPILGVGIVLLCFPSWRRAGMLASILAVFGLGFGSFVSKLGIMQSYEIWVKGGQASRDAASSVVLLLGFSIVLFASLAAGFWATRDRAGVE